MVRAYDFGEIFKTRFALVKAFGSEDMNRSFGQEFHEANENEYFTNSGMNQKKWCFLPLRLERYGRVLCDLTLVIFLPLNSDRQRANCGLCHHVDHRYLIREIKDQLDAALDLDQINRG